MTAKNERHIQAALNQIEPIRATAENPPKPPRAHKGSRDILGMQVQLALDTYAEEIRTLKEELAESQRQLAASLQGQQRIEFDDDWQMGQPNGIGEIEPEDYREWFKPEYNTHRRRVVTITFPWEKLEDNHE